MKKTLLLLDADIIAFAACSADESKFDFGDIQVATNNFDSVVNKMRKDIQSLCEKLKSDRPVICLTDPKDNFRLDVLPSYKCNRDPSKKPELLLQAKRWLKENYESYFMPRLEADDVMGILATYDGYAKGYRKIIVSEDKDMRTIPAEVYNPKRPELGVIKVTPKQADQFHMWQTICGDQVDGYKGAPNVGDKSIYALDVLEETDPLELWDTVLLAFSSVGLKEEDAVVQARCARILRAEDWDRLNKKVIPWEPTKLFW